MSTLAPPRPTPRNKPILTSPSSAASAIAANTFLRSICGATFPLFAVYMFNGMGIEWASTLLGCVAAGLVPIPIVFYLYGGRIRKRSRFAPTFPMAPPPPPEGGDSGDANGAAAASDEGTEHATEAEKEKEAEAADSAAAGNVAPKAKTDKAAEAV